MRDRETIEHEIEEKRQDLVAGIAELKDTVADKVSVKKRARRALVRGKDEAVELTGRAQRFARERPVVVLAVIGGVATLIAVGVAMRRRRRR
jgi:hypothetical protein